MSEIYNRTEMLIGVEAVQKLKKKHIMIFGIGGVGSYSAEAVARVGVGEITLVDKDRVSASNINRQLIALHSTVGMAKVEVMKNRISDINPDIKVNALESFCLPENIDDFFKGKVDYVIDAVDTVSAKLAIVEKCKQNNIGVISAMGAGNKLNPQDFQVADIYKTEECPLCRVMRRELKKRGVKDLKVVYSKEKSNTLSGKINEESGKSIPGSISFVPSAMGLILVGEAIKDLIIK
ncbi:MAG: tRNA threonylcarbamoyladenosine dehydratase [Ruminococcaceae bacterium]|nr:tRNA threonylcarbamoyladenosine dehydratase [Oscillospiraceae bacterium]